jgi:Putative zinc-finger
LMPAMDPEGEDFTQEFGPVFAAMRSARGACPPSERLAQLVAGGVDGTERQALEEHVAMCGRCDALVTRMRAVERNLGREPRWGFVRQPAFAWAAAVVMTVGSAIYVRSAARPVATVSPAAAVGFQAAEFVALREMQRGADEAVRVGGTQPTVVLALAIPAQAGFGYAVRIVPGPERSEPLTISAASGAAYVTINRRDFVPGRYACVVSEADSAGRETGRVFNFPFSF